MQARSITNILREWWSARPRLARVLEFPRADLTVVGLLALLAAASALTIGARPINGDTGSYLVMARSFATTGEFRYELGYTPFYPPLYPIVLAVGGSLLGFTADMARGLNALLFAALVFSSYFVGSGFGRKVGLVAALLVALDPVLVAEAGEGRATLLAALLLVWMFHFVRLGAFDPRRLGWAGLCAGLLFLTKDTTGYVALIGIGVGLVWRVRKDGFKPVVTSPHYLLAGAFFTACYLGWSVRNYVRVGVFGGNPGLAGYTHRFFYETDLGLALFLIVGAAAYLAMHWIGWVFPAFLDPRTYRGRKRGADSPLAAPQVQALMLFVVVTLVISAVMAAVFIRNEGGKVFPDSMPTYYRLVAPADPVLFMGVGLMAFAPVWKSLPGRLESVAPAAKVGAVAVLLLSSWPAVAAHSAESNRAYDEMESYLAANNVTTVYSEAAFLFRPNLPRFEWHQLNPSFQGPTLNHTAAGMPDGGTLITVGYTAEANATIGGFRVILRFDTANPPYVLNPNYEP